MARKYGKLTIRRDMRRLIQEVGLMKLLTRMLLLFLTAFVLVTAAYAKHSSTDIAYAVTGGNIYFDQCRLVRPDVRVKRIGQEMRRS